MGITGLIPFLEKASRKVQLSELRGTTMAVDTYCWLHKGVFCCAEKLVRGEETDKYLQYCLRYVQMLLSYDIKPILVFDGRHLPAKELTEQRRRETRKTSKRLAAELLRAGRTEEARSHMRRCVDVTHEMALRLIRECRIRNVDCIVAPYEADAQLAWLNKMEMAQYVITEDSDLTLFGARKIIFKLDLTGSGLLVEADKLHLAMGCHPDKYTFEKFRRMCILSGCDYLDSLPGIGLAKACKFMLKTEEDDMRRALKKIPAYLNMRHLDVDDNYIESFLRAEATFRHMYIFNPLLRRMERLNSLEVYQTDECWCCNAGTLLEDEQQAFQLALGNLHPFKLVQLDNWHPDNNDDAAKLTKGVTRTKHKSIWRPNYEYSKNTNIKAEYALFFRKVNFMSQAVDEEINANLTEEKAKPAELDLYNMYSNTNEQIKKQSSSLSSNESHIDVDNKDVTTPSKSHCNPFAKVPHDKASISPPVCENTSLLKVLTPQKPKLLLSEIKEKTTTTSLTPPSPKQLQSKSAPMKLNNLKRSLFTLKAPQEVVTTVKSRFFSNNLKESLAPISSTSSAENDVISKLEHIKACAEKQEEQLEFFYNKSPCKKMPRLENAKTPNEKNSIDNSHGDNSDKTENDDVTLISDEESNCEDDNTKTTMPSYKNQIAPRLGLSRNKFTAKTKLAPSQSLLSKFGFQRRPVLK